MAEKTSFGVRRLRQAITNQATCGGQFELSIDSADKLCREIEAELARVSWATGVPAPVDADGNVVPLTTEVMYDGDGVELTVRLICYRPSDGGWVAELCRPFATITNTVINFHLTRPDSWERLEEDVESMLRNGTCAYFGRPGRESCEDCQSFAIDNLSCSHVIVRDVLRRAKALVKRDAKVVGDE